MESITAQVRNLASRANDAARKKLIAGLQELAIKLETSSDTMDRITLLHLRIAAVRTAIDFKLFDVLAASKEPMTLNHLAEKTNVDPIFLGRLLRYLSSTSMMKETGKNAFTATNVTKTLADPGNQGGLRHYFDTCGPMFQAMPKYLAKIRYQNITKANETVFQEAFKTHKGPFAWYVEDDPETFAFFGEYMAARRKGMTGWLDVYPVEEETKNWDPSAPVFVDIGGGIGHQCVDLKTKHPDLPGKIVLQEYKDNVEHAQLPPGIEKMEHDMFTPQPVNGARFYHLRHVLHDWPDDECQVILGHIVAAMGPDSAILLEEMVLPDTNVAWQAAQIDLEMMCAFGSRERTEEQWVALLDSVGLRIEKVLVHRPETHESVIVAIKK